MTENQLAERAREVEARVETYLHTAKRIAMNVFGAAAEHHHNTLTVEIASALVNLEAAHVIAGAGKQE